jgi:hypothetical protein
LQLDQSIAYAKIGSSFTGYLPKFISQKSTWGASMRKFVIVLASVVVLSGQVNSESFDFAADWNHKSLDEKTREILVFMDGYHFASQVLDVAASQVAKRFPTSRDYVLLPTQVVRGYDYVYSGTNLNLFLLFVVGSLDEYYSEEENSMLAPGFRTTNKVG